MIIQPSPVRSDDKVKYKFNNESILVTINNNDESLIDLSNIEVDKQYEIQFPIRGVKRNKNGDLEVTLVKYHGANATEEERFPEPFESVEVDFETNLKLIQLKEIQPEVIDTSPTSEDLLMLAIAELDSQREEDKLENQLAMAELAETLIGGF